MRFLQPDRDENFEASLEDVFLVPGYYDGTSRLEVDLTPVDFPGGSHPLVSANMNGVTGKRMAETMARYGGIGVLPQDMDLKTVDRIVRFIKSADARLDTPLTVRPGATLRDVQGFIRKRAHDMVVVIDDLGRPLGLVTHADLRDRDQYTPVERLMARRLVTLPMKTTNQDAYARMDEERLKAVPVVDEANVLRGILTKEDAVRLEVLRPALNGDHQLMVAVAIGISQHTVERAKAISDLGADVLVVDTAHGHQRRMLEALEGVRSQVPSHIPVVAGNVCTAEGARALIEAGADIIKVNVGPGAMCTTRMQTGVGRPTFSSVRVCAEEARRHGKHVWADGGVRHPRDVALYLAAGASRVMIGTLLAGTYESPGDIKEDRDGRLYKENFGMASARAVMGRTEQLDSFEQAKRLFFEEGISASRIYLREGRESVGAIVVEFLTGLKSSFTYVGATSVSSFWEKAVVGVQSSAGFQEGRAQTTLG